MVALVVVRGRNGVGRGDDRRSRTRLYGKLEPSGEGLRRELRVLEPLEGWNLRANAALRALERFQRELVAVRRERAPRAHALGSLREARVFGLQPKHVPSSYGLQPVRR